jgi:hypothetical protein
MDLGGGYVGRSMVVVDGNKEQINSIICRQLLSYFVTIIGHIFSTIIGNYVTQSIMYYFMSNKLCEKKDLIC